MRPIRNLRAATDKQMKTGIYRDHRQGWTDMRHFRCGRRTADWELRPGIAHPSLLGGNMSRARSEHITIGLATRPRNKCNRCNGQGQRKSAGLATEQSRWTAPRAGEPS